MIYGLRASHSVSHNIHLQVTDSKLQIKNICKSENIDVKQLSPKFILAIIDRWKNKGYYPNEVKINHKDIYEKTILPIFDHCLAKTLIGIFSII